MKRLFLLAFVVAFGYRSSAECVQASRSECEAAKSSLASGVDEAMDAISGLYTQKSFLIEEAYSLQADASIVGPAINYVLMCAGGAFDSLQNAVLQDVTLLDNFNISSALSDLQEASYYDYAGDMANNVSWTADSIIADLEGLGYSLDDLSTLVADIGKSMDGFDCEPCTDGGPGSGGGGGGCEGDGGCPCSALLQSLQITLEHIDADLHEIKQRLQYWEKYIKMLEEIRDKVKSIDDFMQDDLKEAMKNFFKSFFDVSDYKDPPKVQWYKLYTEEMARSWFFDDYTNASAFVQKDAGRYDFLEKGKLIFNSPQHPNNFDSGEYQNFNWFQRVEFMLGNLVGVFSTTNTVAADLTESQKREAEDQEQRVQDAFGEGAFTDSQSLVNGLFDSIEGIQSKLNPFHGLFSSSHNAQPIEILPETAVSSVLVQNTSPGIYLETGEFGHSGFGLHDVVDVAHNLTTFIYLVFFVVVDIIAFVFFVRGLMAIVQWYHKIVLSWVKTFNVR